MVYEEFNKRRYYRTSMESLTAFCSKAIRGIISLEHVFLYIPWNLFTCIVPCGGICPWFPLGASWWLQEAPRIYHHFGRAAILGRDSNRRMRRWHHVDAQIGKHWTGGWWGGGAPLFNLVAGTSIKGAGVMDMPPLGEDIAVEGTGDGRTEGRNRRRSEGRQKGSSEVRRNTREV